METAAFACLRPRITEWMWVQGAVCVWGGWFREALRLGTFLSCLCTRSVSEQKLPFTRQETRSGAVILSCLARENILNIVLGKLLLVYGHGLDLYSKVCCCMPVCRGYLPMCHHQDTYLKSGILTQFPSPFPFALGWLLGAWALTMRNRP